MKVFMKTLQLLPVFASLVILTGCLGLEAKPDPSRFYVLGGGFRETAPEQVDCSDLVRVGPVSLAGHLDNPKIVRRVGENEIQYFDWRFWAAPLSRALPGELIASLKTALPNTCVSSYRDASPGENSAQLELLVEQFELTNEGNVIVSASWGITSGHLDSRRQGRATVSRAFEPGTDEVVSGVRALTIALGDLAKIIAEDLR